MNTTIIISDHPIMTVIAIATAIALVTAIAVHPFLRKGTLEIIKTIFGLLYLVFMVAFLLFAGFTTVILGILKQTIEFIVQRKVDEFYEVRNYNEHVLRRCQAERQQRRQEEEENQRQHQWEQMWQNIWQKEEENRQLLELEKQERQSRLDEQQKHEQVLQQMLKEERQKEWERQMDELKRKERNQEERAQLYEDEKNKEEEECENNQFQEQPQQWEEHNNRHWFSRFGKVHRRGRIVHFFLDSSCLSVFVRRSSNRSTRSNESTGNRSVSSNARNANAADASAEKFSDLLSRPSSRRIVPIGSVGDVTKATSIAAVMDIIMADGYRC